MKAHQALWPIVTQCRVLGVSTSGYYAWLKRPPSLHCEIDIAIGDHIEAFYDAVFAHGYRGSIGRGEVVSERALSPDISLIDAQWSISGARTPGGAPRGDETGIMAAVIGRTEEGWRILALRENGGASTFSPFPPTR